MYNVQEIATYIVNKSNDLGYSISNLKLQKILYFVQAEFLVTTNSPCFNEPIEAWDLGPVVPVVYRRFKIFGSASIPKLKSEFNIAYEDRGLIDGIVEQCADYSASALVSITHNQEPWKEAYKPNQNSTISQVSIKQFFGEN